MKYIYIGAEWCNPCKVFKPQFEKICKEKGLNYEILDAEKDEEKVSKYSIRNVPFIVVEDKNGNIVDRGMAVEILKKM